MLLIDVDVEGGVVEYLYDVGVGGVGDCCDFVL